MSDCSWIEANLVLLSRCSYLHRSTANIGKCISKQPPFTLVVQSYAEQLLSTVYTRTCSELVRLHIHAPRDVCMSSFTSCHLAMQHTTKLYCHWSTDAFLLHLLCSWMQQACQGHPYSRASDGLYLGHWGVCCGPEHCSLRCSSWSTLCRLLHTCACM